MYSKSFSIPTFVINPLIKQEGYENIISELDLKKEFNVQLTPVVSSSEKGQIDWGLTLQKIVKLAKDNKMEFVLICKSDLIFTDNYCLEELKNNIETAEKMEADILLGGLDWFDFNIKIGKDLYWINKFYGAKFYILFDKFFNSVLAQKIFFENDNFDSLLSTLSDNKLVSFPFFSIQKDFNENGSLKTIQETQNTFPIGGSERFRVLEAVYKHINSTVFTDNIGDYKDYKLSTFIINTLERKDRLKSIKEQFSDKFEFDLNILSFPKEENGAKGLWNNIKKAISSAIESDEDVILICEDDHVFTSKYSEKVLFDSIFQGASLGAELILGGISNYNQGIVATPNLIWIAGFQCTQFTILYKNIFNKILNIEFLEDDSADLMLSRITSNKYIIHPFISYQKDFGYSDIPISGVFTENYDEWFKLTESSLNSIRNITKQKGAV